MPAGEGALGLFYVDDLIDVPAGFTGWSLNDGQIAHFLFQQRASHRGVDGDVVLTTKNFIVADNAKTQSVAIVVFNLHPRAEEHFALLLRGVIDNFEILETLRQVANPAVNFAQPLFVVLVVSVFAAIAQACRPGHLFGYFRTLFAPEVIHLFFELFVPFAGDQGRFHGKAFAACRLTVLRTIRTAQCNRQD